MRIKVTGYLETDDMDPAHLNFSRPSGLSLEGEDALMSSLYRGVNYKTCDLEDIEAELES